ncbi:hypothetical protein PYCCODRAFT_1371732 [Trametes coccinea BRFM310]|uniref:F-box domain-containing protein n=1 Tax=Trametes coccinea (strain BRFM310) TaxID=1353009 RepID=A0A1Y2IHL5_TRAC3|nr:hypothetical protein PYCCODRAFT_1371732 [Trametes coccinea BRFM310]
MSPIVPLEVIEGIIGYLSAVPDALQQCSLICRQLLPASRGHLWRTVRLDITERGLKSPRMESFLELLNDSPTIAWCVRRVIVKYQEDSLAGEATSDLTMATTLCRWFPNVRSLTLTNFRAPTFYDAISMARNLPTIVSLDLQSFRLSKLLSDWPSSAEPSTAAPDGCWALRELAISGLLPAEEHSNLVAFLKRSTEVVPIRSFAFCTPSVMFSPWPLSLELRPGIPSFAASLRHFGTSVSEITDTIQAYQPGRDYTRHVMANLRSCKALRSLDFQYDCTAVFLSRLFLSNSVEPETISLPSFFIRELADVLSEPGAPSCPLLEEILLEVLAPHSWITTWAEDLGRLASALATQDAEGNRRYPNFARFSLRSSILHIIRPGLGRRAEEAAERQRNAEKSGLEMLEPFAKAGIKVELDIC